MDPEPVSMIVSRDLVHKGFLYSSRAPKGPVMWPDLDEMWVRLLTV